MFPRFATYVGFFTLSAWAPMAFAYIDPGTGSILIQGLIAAVAAVGVALKLYWHRFIGLFRRKPDINSGSENLDLDSKEAQENSKN